MTQRAARPLLFLLVAAAVLSMGSCFADAGPLGAAPTGGSNQGATHALGGVTGQGAEGGSGAVCVARPPKAGASCRPVESAEPLHVRLVSESQEATVFVDDLFQQFKSHCGGCHVDTNLGNFQALPINFPRTVDEKALKAIRSNTDACGSATECLNYMPPAPTGKPWSEREQDPSDPLRKFALQLEEWLKQGRPTDTFVCGSACAETLAAGPGWAVTEEFAASLTNLGSCIPDEGMFGTEAGESCDLDARFAAMAKDPTSDKPHEKLGLPLTLDQTDLVTFDSATLAPFGVIAYAPTYPLWTDGAGKLRHVRVPRGESIRYNREFKTFEIPDNTRFYKTFLKEVIVADGTKRFRKIETRVIVARGNEQALFGTYEWNDAENQATLVTSPLRNGEPFTDVLKTLIIDEPKAAAIKALKDAGEIRNYAYELDAQQAVRRYAIPGSERCIQCHQGSESFVLGFSPLQVNRRACTEETLATTGHCEGGVLEPAGADEASQLERLIAYGVITGFDPELDVARLEDPQGSPAAPRPSRSPEELVAQGYLLGNCAHCHNPIGYPTRLNPELGPLLDFLPSEQGGIFGFPFERYSPRVKRGSLGDIPLPYITPSLRDIIPAVGDPGAWNPKEVPAPAEGGGVVRIDAPWRSLIYRNVDTPSTYSEHFAIYPHMPLNSPGFDCRAPRLLGEWMVSIPALKKHPELNEDVQTGLPLAETDPQPYVEVLPSAPNYLSALAQTQKRLEAYRKGSRYAYCPDTSDIVDLDVVRGKRLVPEDASWRLPNGGLAAPKDSVPDRSHWVVTDLTEAPGAWAPRRTDWEEIFAALPEPPANATKETKDAWAAEKQVLDLLEGFTPSAAFKQFAASQLPLGVWQEKPECASKLQKQQKVSDFQGAGRARWMDLLFDPEKEGRPVFKTTPGAAVFNMICVNCHGPDADSKGRQASTLQDMTGGTGRVANFRDGLFGPAGSDGENLRREFGTQDRAAQYLAWMALGGTKTRIPQAILDLVKNTEVVGLKRPAIGSTKSANMLQVAQNLCVGVGRLGTTYASFKPELLGQVKIDKVYDLSGLITTNGDAELWKKLCTFENAAPIRVGRIAPGDDPYVFLTPGELYRSAAYPADQPVGTELGEVAASLSVENYLPWCVRAPVDPKAVAWLAEARGSDGKKLPVCPEPFLSETNRLEVGTADDGQPTYPDLERWAARGAINAGFAVFLFLNDFIGSGMPREPRYNECELLPD